VFKYFVAKVKTYLERKVSTLHTNRGREYLYDMFKEFCEEKGIRKQQMISCARQHNGIIERMC